MTYPKRLIEVDLPIKRISAHARREKSIRHGHISTLHIWWARRPLAACRAVICAALWPDPADANCPQAFRDAATWLMTEFAKKVVGKTKIEGKSLLDTCSAESLARWEAIANAGISLDPLDERHQNVVRLAILDFIADFANWDNSTVPVYLETARALTQAAHESLGGEPGTRPLVVDPFAGGGSIPLEALRVGADVFASDLNPVAVLLNKVVLEYIPKYGQRLAEEVRKWGTWVKEQAEKELAEFYPKDSDGATTIAYLWARTILSESPDQGDTPAEVPLIRSLWLCKKPNRRIALRWILSEVGTVQTERIAVPYGDAATRFVRRPMLELFHPNRDSDVGPGTVTRGSATCPVTGYTTPVASVRTQLKARRGGADDARLICVVTSRANEQGRFYRPPTEADLATVRVASAERESRQRDHRGALSAVPNEQISLNEIRRISVPIYGMALWGDVFSARQSLVLQTLASCGAEVGRQCEPGMSQAVVSLIALALGRQADACSSLARWHTTGEKNTGTFGRQALGMVWDFAEVNPFSGSTGGWEGAIEWIAKVCESQAGIGRATGHVERASATKHPLSNDIASAWITDPPYYDAVPYAHLSDYFYVWLRRMLHDVEPVLFSNDLAPKDEEVVVDRPHSLSTSKKDVVFYERELTKAFAEGRRVLRPDGICTIVFASKTTASWEAILKAVVDAGWVITGSWPIDTEMEARVAAQGQARLASSVHLVCRPRENPDGSVQTAAVGDWRDVLAELPPRIHDWMRRLTSEGVVGADAIFACLGPALEIFSRYSRVERSSGEVVSLADYLTEVWAAVSKEAISMIFQDADASGWEPDARFTAMWLWTVGGGQPAPNGHSKPIVVKAGVAKVGVSVKSPTKEVDEAGELVEADSDLEEIDATGDTKNSQAPGYVVEFDTASKIAKGLGAHLERMESVVEIKGDRARLLPVAERARYLFGKDDGDGIKTTPRGKAKKLKQKHFFEELGDVEPSDSGWAGLKGPPPGATALDRLHQAMILFAAGRGELMKRFLVDEGVGSDGRFWKLAQSLSALYPSGSDEKRWVDGVLARKKGLGL